MKNAKESSPAALQPFAFASRTLRRCCRLGPEPQSRVVYHPNRKGTPPFSKIHDNVRLMAVIDEDYMISIPLDPTTTTSSAASVPATPPGFSSDITRVHEFEPVLNAQAATSFVIIAIVFTLLQLRINAILNAAKRRSKALKGLRRAESLQLSGNLQAMGIDSSSDPLAIEEQVTRAKEKYENALREEMDLRTIVSGIRIVAPNDPKTNEEERAAAKRFLGWGRDEFGDGPDDDISRNSRGLEQKDGYVDKSRNNTDKGLTNGAKLILFGVASVLIVLLWGLSFDPMVSDQVFTTV